MSQNTPAEIWKNPCVFVDCATWGEFFPVCETPQWLRGLETNTGAIAQSTTWWVKFGLNCPF